MRRVVLLVLALALVGVVAFARHEGLRESKPQHVRTLTRQEHVQATVRAYESWLHRKPFEPWSLRCRRRLVSEVVPKGAASECRRVLLGRHDGPAAGAVSAYLGSVEQG